MSVSKTHAFDTDVLSDWFYNKHRLSIFNHLFIIYKNISNHTIIITFNLIHKLHCFYYTDYLTFFNSVTYCYICIRFRRC